MQFARDLGSVRAAALVALLTVAGLAIRLAQTRGLWLDEAISLRQAQLGLPELIQDLAHGDRHPPVHHLLLWATVRLFGDAELALRAPSLAAGALLVPAVYWLAAELFDRRTGVAAAVLTTVAPILVWYSHEVRGYSLEALFSTLAVVGCVRAIRRGRPADWALHVIASALAIGTHWFAIFVIAATEGALLVALLRRRRLGRPVGAWLRRWALATVALLAQLAPLAALAAAQVQATGTGGGYAGAAAAGSDGLSFYTVVSNVSWSLFGFHPDVATRALSAVWPLLILVALLPLGRGVRRRGGFLLACAVVPVLALLILGLRSPDVFDARYFIVAVPAVLVLLAYLAVNWPDTRRGRAAVLGGLTLAFAGCVVDQQLNPDNPRRYDYQAGLAEIRSRMGPRDVLLYEPPELRFVLARYAPDMRTRELDGVLPTRAEADGVVVLASFLDQPRYRQVVDRQLGALRATRREGSHETFPGVSVWSFR